MSMALAGPSVRFGRLLSLLSAKERNISSRNKCSRDVVEIQYAGLGKAAEGSLRNHPSA